ncbi:MAG: metallophosphoesterase family protein [bacterium JZ-2024 1]
MMRILVISDTHIPQAGKTLPETIYQEIEKADAIIHAGDWTVASALDELLAFQKPVYGVYGNMDDVEVSSRLPEARVENLGGYRVGVTHGSGPPEGILDRVLAKFRDFRPEVVIYGHTHRPHIEFRADLMVLNPGSPLDRRWSPRRSYAILLLRAGGPEARLIGLP